MTEAQEQPRQSDKFIEPTYELHRDELSTPVRKHADGLYAQISAFYQQHEIKNFEELPQLVETNQVSTEEARRLSQLVKKLHAVCEIGVIPVEIDWDQVKELKRLKGHKDIVASLDVLSDGTIVSGSKDGTVRLWEPERDQEIKKVSFNEPTKDGHTRINPILSLATLPKDHIAIATYGGVSIWDSRMEQRVSELEKSEKKGQKIGAVDSITAFADADFATGNRNEYGPSICIWDANTYQFVKRIPVFNITCPQSFIVTPDGKVAVGNNWGEIEAYDLHGAKSIGKSKGGYRCSSKNSIARLPYNKIAATRREEDNTWICYLDLENMEEVTRFSVGKRTQQKIFTIGDKLIYEDLDNIIHVHDSKTSKEIGKFSSGSGTMAAAVLSGDNKIITANSNDILIFGK